MSPELLFQHFLSRSVGLLTHSKWPLIKNSFIDWFIKQYGVDMSIAENPEPHSYATFNDFFTRRLRAGERPIADGKLDIISPADGVISQVGMLDYDQIMQAKGFEFTAQELLGGCETRAAPFFDGHFITVYLSPKDYHRVHMPMTGKLREMIHIPGHLFSVNPKNAEKIPRLFARNERMVAIFETARGLMAVVMVGALLVASIVTSWAGKITPPLRSKIRRVEYPLHAQQYIQLQKGEELGYFELGSTVILLFSDKKVQFEKNVVANSAIRMGQLLGTLT